MPTNFRRTTVLFFVALGVSLPLASCSSDDSSSTEGATETTEAADTSSKELAAIEERGKPEVTVPPAPATELKITDLVEGTGPAVQPTDSVTVHYVGVGQQSGKEFDSSWSRGEPISFPLNGVIKGWSEGLVGMKVGGRRELVIPGSLAYGPNPPSPDIAPDETLVFVVDLVAIN